MVAIYSSFSFVSHNSQDKNHGPELAMAPFMFAGFTIEPFDLIPESCFENLDPGHVFSISSVRL